MDVGKKADASVLRVDKWHYSTVLYFHSIPVFHSIHTIATRHGIVHTNKEEHNVDRQVYQHKRTKLLAIGYLELLELQSCRDIL